MHHVFKLKNNPDFNIDQNNRDYLFFFPITEQPYCTCSLPFLLSAARSFCRRSDSLPSAFLCRCNSLRSTPRHSCMHSRSFFCSMGGRGGNKRNEEMLINTDTKGKTKLDSSEPVQRDQRWVKQGDVRDSLFIFNYMERPNVRIWI